MGWAERGAACLAVNVGEKEVNDRWKCGELDTLESQRWLEMFMECVEMNWREMTE